METGDGTKKASDFDQELLNLYDGFAHGQISRREFLDKAAKFAVGGVTAAALLGSLAPDYALAEQVAPDHPSIEAEMITYESRTAIESRTAMARSMAISSSLPVPPAGCRALSSSMRTEA